MVVLDLKRFEKIKGNKKLKELRVGGLWWVQEEKKETNVGGKRRREYDALWWDLI